MEVCQQLSSLGGVRDMWAIVTTILYGGKGLILMKPSLVALNSFSLPNHRPVSTI